VGCGGKKVFVDRRRRGMIFNNPQSSLLPAVLMFGYVRESVCVWMASRNMELSCWMSVIADGWTAESEQR
jgi:hypothetical protein